MNFNGEKMEGIAISRRGGKMKITGREIAMGLVVISGLMATDV